MLDRLTWDPLLAADAKHLVIRALYGEGDSHRLEATEVKGRFAPLPFYQTFAFNHLILQPADGESLALFVLASSERAYVLDGTVGPIRQVLYEEGSTITEASAADYLRFYCFGLRTAKGPFLLFEKPAVDPSDIDATYPDRPEAWRERAQVIAMLAAPMEADGRDEEGRFLFRVPVHYDDTIWRSRFAVGAEGEVQMLDDEALAQGVPSEVLPALPDLYPAEIIRMRLEALHAGRRSGASILRVLVELLLEEALAEEPSSRLLTHFNAQHPEHGPLERFARFVATAHPVVAIESTLPFVEDTVAELVQYWGGDAHRMNVVHPSVDPNDDTRIQIQYPGGDGIVLIPFHAYRSIIDVERVAHNVAARDVPCLIGCARSDDLPAPLRQVVDLTLHLPRLTSGLFAELFRRVMGTSPPEGWQQDDVHWVTHVHHSDFQHPQGLELTPEQTLEHVRARATRRLRDVEPAEGLRLSELHGLGEARRFAEDLIADLHQAIAGELDWDQVDRGVLLAGAPGTGKTTLARAIAKDCGIRFVNASAASWQAAGYLNDHIRALRSDFQLARRFAPAILFIDEIDSIGSRDDFDDHNAQYHTQVVNALLEQLQGMDPEAPVIVIAATNHPDRIDPALKRAGRLDYVIEIPRPNAQALADIFRHYLEEYADDKRVSDIDPEILGGMAFGLTGADVERIVRGAARRARRAGCPIRQSDLIDEITRKPRDEASSPRLTPEEIRRVAVHESGHAMAAYLSETRGEDISFVSIVPRADGTLGFVARMPSERSLVTRQEYLERLEIILGGRAAEEIVFGEDGVTGGARSDLRIATQSALMMTTQFGLGPERNLLWSDAPSDAQKAEANQVLSEAYATALGKLRADADALGALADALEKQQELTGDEVRALLRQ